MANKFIQEALQDIEKLETEIRSTFESYYMHDNGILNDMAVILFFKAARALEQAKRLHEDLIIEGLPRYETIIYYLPRTLINEDLVLGEDTS